LLFDKHYEEQAASWKGKHPSIVLVEGNYPTGVIVPKKEMNEINKRIIRSEKLPSYDILVLPNAHAAGRLQPAASLTERIGSRL